LIRRRLTWPISLAILYALFAWGLAIALPYRPRAVIELPWEEGQADTFDKFALSADGSTLLAVSQYEQHHGVECHFSLVAWDCRSGRQKLSEFNTPGRMLWEYGACDLSPDGSFFVGFADGDGSEFALVFWDMESGRRTNAIPVGDYIGRVR